MDRAVFINYRGEDSTNSAAWLYTALTDRFGDAHIFLDAESIPAGANFIEELLGHVRSARVMLAVIGPRWLTATHPRNGHRLIDDPADWIHRELVEAFAAGVRVIPVLTDDATLPREADLPPDIAALSRCQYRHLRRREPTSDIARIVADLADLDPTLPAVTDHRRADHVSIVDSVPAGAARTPPAQLPPDVTFFTGRTEELATLDTLLDADTSADRSSQAVVISAIAGAGGMGKGERRAARIVC